MSKVLRVAGTAGIVVPFFVFACVLSAVASWPSFSWVNNALSDLGVQWGLTATVFNAGLIIGGFLFMIFAAGLFTFLGKRALGKLGAGLFSVAFVALAAIGVFNETFSPLHFIVSVMLFVFAALSLLVFFGVLWLDGKRSLSMLTLTLGLFAAATWVLEYVLHYVPGVAIPEFVSSAAGATWIVIVGYLMLKSAQNTTS